MRFRSIIFDLDGTLVDSLPGIEASLRYAVDKCLPARPLPPLREIVGPPVTTMLARLWPDLDPDRLQAVIAAFREHYDSVGCLLSEPYPGVVEILRTLHRHELQLFVLTNKPGKPTVRILTGAHVADLFTGIVSPDSMVPPFPAKSDGALFLRERFRLDPAGTVVVGDGADDAQAAAANGFSFILAEYGYGAQAADPSLTKVAALKTFFDIEQIVLSEKSSS